MRNRFAKRHYEAIAEILADVKFHAEKATFNAVVGQLAQMFVCDNPNFSRVRFCLACGIELDM